MPGTSAEETQTKRQFPRLPVHLPASLKVREEAWTGHTVNLSLRGCQLLLAPGAPPPATDAAASLQLTFPSGTTSEIPARVVTSGQHPEGLAAALEFGRVDAALLAYLRLRLTAHARHESGEHRRLR